MPRPLNYDESERDAKIIALASQGLALNVIARRFGLSPTRIGEIAGTRHAQKASA